MVVAFEKVAWFTIKLLFIIFLFKIKYASGFIGVKVLGRVDTSSSLKLEDDPRVQWSPYKTIRVRVLKDENTPRKICKVKLVCFLARSRRISLLHKSSARK